MPRLRLRSALLCCASEAEPWQKSGEGAKDQKNCTPQLKGGKVREIFMKSYANLLSSLLYFIFS
jgi:hypothetical protein